MSEQNTEVKRFVAPTMSRALELVRDEMGPEAIILSSKKVSGGIEIVTSIERDLPTRGVTERRAFGQNFDTDLDQAMDSDTSWQSQAGIEQAAASYAGKVEVNGADEKVRRMPGEDIALEIERARERMLAAKRAAASGEKISTPRQTSAPAKRVDEPSANRYQSLQEDPQESRLTSLRSELDDLRMLFEQQMWNRSNNTVSSAMPVEQKDDSHNDILSDHLTRLGLAKPVINQLITQVGKNGRISDLWKQCLARLARKIPIASHINTDKGGVFAFVGPTGVGKTTTLAKLASQYSIAHGPGKVAIVSMDTHRVGAIEQLRALGRIIESPVRAVSGEASLMTTLSSLRDFPLVLIDTAGFRHGDPKLKEQLNQLDQNPTVKRMLVLSSVSQFQTLKASIHAYRPRRDTDGCVISKLDEASSIGEAISAIVQHELAVAYVTDGQQIPTDIRNASSHNLVASAVEVVKRQAVLDSASL